MSKLRCHISVSLDGCVAGPNQSHENPLGEGGESLHDWVVKLAAWREAHGKEGGEVNESTAVLEEAHGNLGATLMGRNMFGPPEGGPWGEDPWNGWWGENPPYHHPVFVVTHHEREPLEMEGGTTFHFVTDGVEAAAERAKAAAGEGDVMLAGGGQIIGECLAAGVVDVLELHVVPIVLGRGARIFDDVVDADLQLKPVRAVQGAGATHVKYEVGAA